MQKYKRYFLALLFLPILLLASMFLCNAALDPDRILSKGNEYPFFSKGKKHYKIAGIIKNYPIRNIIVGGSLMANIIPSEVEAVLGWKDVYSLTLNAADAATVSAITGLALRKHKIANVLISLQPDRLATISPAQQGKRGSLKNFINLYDDNSINDLMVFLQTPVYFFQAYCERNNQEKTLKTNFPGLTEDEILTASKDSFSHYMQLFQHFNRPLFISSLESTDKPPVKLTEEYKRNLAENFALHIEPLISQNPDTQFKFVVEPTTFLGRRANRHVFSYALQFLSEKLMAYRNVKIYSFSNDAFNEDLRLFKDLDHPHIEVNRFMIQSIANDNHRLTRENIKQSISAFAIESEKYRIAKLWETKNYEFFKSPYPKAGYLTNLDAAKLTWGKDFSQKMFNQIPRSRFVTEYPLKQKKLVSIPPLNASRKTLMDVRLTSVKSASE